nr:zinc finger CCCH domain-containing protein 14 [Fagopyrum tataricum]
MDFGGARKRGRGEAPLNGNGGFKKSRHQESESFPSGVGSKSKPCTKFFSTSGCPFGEGCHFMHYVPGGYKAVAQAMNLGGSPAPPQPPVPFPDNLQSTSTKTRLCNKYNTAEGCRYGDKCHFAHGEWELGKPAIQTHEEPRSMGHMPGGGRIPFPGGGFGPASGFGLSSTAKISVDASLAGPIIGKGGVNSKQISRVTGAKLSIRDHESDPSLKNIELEGTFDQIKQASDMVHELIMNVRAASGRPPHSKGPPPRSSSAGGANNFKTKLCENFTKGSCTFGDRCHFAHGAEELRKGPM